MSESFVKRILTAELPDADDDEVTAATFSDPDALPLTAAQVAGMRRRVGRPPGSGIKKRVTLRIDADVLERYRSTGEDWQTRLNADLRKAAGLL